MNKYLALFDLDGTILTVNSGSIIARAAKSEGLLSPGDMRLGLFLSLLKMTGIVNTRYMVEKMSMVLKDKPVSSMKSFVSRLFHSEMKHLLREKVVEEIEFHKTNGGQTVILSASTDFTCEPFREHLDMDDMICSQMEERDGSFTGRFIGEYCYGGEKLNRLREYVSSRGFSMDNSYYYGDALADRHVLMAVDNPVCVAPVKKLRELALQNNWPIIE